MGRPRSTRSNRQRFNDLISRTSNGNSCHIFTRTGQPRQGQPGYGMFELHDAEGKSIKTVAAHRYAWEMHRGPIPPDTCVRHVVCDTPACVNVRHMALGSKKDNSADAVRKGRLHPECRRERIPLSDKDKKLILDGYKAGRSIYSIARDVGRWYCHCRNVVRSAFRREQQAMDALVQQLTPTPPTVMA
jgi:hypothetical protein